MLSNHGDCEKSSCPTTWDILVYLCNFANIKIVKNAPSRLRNGRDPPGFENLTGLFFISGEESVGLRLNLLQIRLNGPYFAAFLSNRTTIALQNQQNLFSPSRIFASIS